jgi:hypothetical protein
MKVWRVAWFHEHGTHLVWHPTKGVAERTIKARKHVAPFKHLKHHCQAFEIPTDKVGICKWLNKHLSTEPLIGQLPESDGADNTQNRHH